MTGGIFRIRIALSVVVALAAVACGGDDDGGEDAQDVQTDGTDLTENAGQPDDAGDGDDDGSEASGAVDPADIKTDFGADDEVIRVGMIADLSGAFSGIVKDTVVAQQAFWDKVNAEGGIGGRQIELVIEDNKYDVPTHKTLFRGMSAEEPGGVLIFSQSTGSPHTAAIKAELEEGNLIAIPVSFYSGWAEPSFGKNVFEAYTNYCFEAMNILDWMYRNQDVQTVALATFPGEAGLDGANGLKIAAEALGVEVVYDGAGQISPPTPTTPNPDVSGVVNSIVSSKADVAFIAANPAALAQVMGGAAAKGFKGKWTGFAPTYSPTLLKSDVGEILDSSFYQSSYTVALGTDVPGMDEMLEAIKARQPGAVVSDFYVYGWTEAQITEAILRAAADAGDLTRAGVVKAAFALDEVDFGGLAPAQSWKGDPNDYIVRESYMFKPKLSLYKEGPVGEGSTGSELLEGPFASQVARDYDFEASGACFKAAG